MRPPEQNSDWEIMVIESRIVKKKKKNTTTFYMINED